MKIKLDHVNISVKNLNESIAWYQDLFDFLKVESGINEFGRQWAILASDDSMVAMSEWPKRNRSQDENDRDAHHIYHFGIRVSDLREWNLKLEKYKIPLEYGQKIEYPNSTSWYIVDPSGHKIEVSYSEGLPLQFSK